MNQSVAMQVESLHIYPIKSCAGINLRELHFAPDGHIVMDREWAVVDPKGEVTWQGAYPRLALVKPEYDGITLTLATASGSAYRIPPLQEHNTCNFRIWNDQAKRSEVHHGMDAGDEAAEFLQEVTGTELRLVRLSREAIEQASTHPVHLISRQSLEELNRFRQARGEEPASIMRFRPNIVLSGGEKLGAFPEEHVTQLSRETREGAWYLEIIERCIRCIVPDVDPEIGTITSGVLKAVAQLSAERYPGQPPSLGVYGRARQAGILRTGATVVAEL
jgi:uncharacterized protein